MFSGFMATHTSPFDLQWYTWVFVAIGIIAVLGWLRVDLNAKVLAIFLTLEIIVVVIFDLVVARRARFAGDRPRPVQSGHRLRRRARRRATFTMAAFVGFESAAIYGEEVKDPRRTVARATYIALGITSIFYALSAWMLASAVGSDVITDPRPGRGWVHDADGAAPDPTTILFITLDAQISTTVADIATLLFCTSLFAAMLSFHNAVGRYFFALGRAGVLPRRSGAPAATAPRTWAR